MKAYPEARSYACPGLPEKQPQIAFAGTVGVDHFVPPEWHGEIECTFLSYERNPFTNTPFFNEVNSLLSRFPDNYHDCYHFFCEGLLGCLPY